MNKFVDQVQIIVASGHGGAGTIAWRREKYEPLGGPAGGSGGRGGSVYLKASENMMTLADFRYKARFEAPAGTRGGPKNKSGRDGQDLILPVPVGCLVFDDESGSVIADLVQPGQLVMVAEGGTGGRGNTQLATATRRSPHFCEPGEAGIVRKLKLELKLLADIGIIGMPNAGKSTLLSILTRAKPKIANYPFSTLDPNLGVLRKPDGDGWVIADIPGLIEGASEGVGLGHKFLRHIERTRILIHLADISSPNLDADIKTIITELALYGKAVSKLPQIIVLNKADLLNQEEQKRITKHLMQKLSGESSIALLPKTPPIVLSCATKQGVDILVNKILEVMNHLDKPPILHETQEDSKASIHPEHTFSISQHKKTFSVTSDYINSLVEVTDLRDPESIHHLISKLRKLGVIDALVKEGAKDGSEIVIGGMTFIFGEDFI